MFTGAAQRAGLTRLKPGAVIFRRDALEKEVAALKEEGLLILGQVNALTQQLQRETSEAYCSIAGCSQEPHSGQGLPASSRAR
jgi:hypothetical protein